MHCSSSRSTADRSKNTQRMDNLESQIRQLEADHQRVLARTATEAPRLQELLVVFLGERYQISYTPSATILHNLNRSSGFMLLLVRLWDVSPSRFASGLRNDAPRADCAPAPPRRALYGHAPSRGSKSDVSPDVL